MDSISSAVVWCTVQVSLVATIGTGLSLMVTRRDPFAASSGLCMTIVVCAGLTLLAPLPAHRWFLVNTRLSAAAPGFHPDVVPSEKHEAGELPVSTPMFDWRDLVSPLRSLVSQAHHIEQRSNAAVHSAGWLLAAVLAFGLWRLAAGWALVVRIRRRSVAISDEGLLNLLREIAGRMECPANFEIRESRDFADAAVAGWLRPVVILPAGWREWNDDERRTVLAHETAHILRRDALWRLLAASVAALHFYNPLIHWLIRRLMLCQELASDTLAVQTVGQRCYLRSLSSLALRQDDRLGSGVASSVLPVFSGHLIRRIKMLNSMKDEPAAKPVRRRTLTATVMFTLFLALGLAAVATRGIAQPPSGEFKIGTATVRGVSLTKVIPGKEPALDATREMFRYAPLNPAEVGSINPKGMAVLRLHEVLQRPEFKGFVPIANAFFSSTISQEMHTTSAPPVSLEAVDWIATHPFITYTAKAGQEKSRFMVGAGGFVVRLSQPFDLKAWFDHYAPENTRHVVEEKDVFRVTLAALGPNGVFVWMDDQRTIRVGHGTPKEITAETTLADLRKDRAASQPSANNADDAASPADSSPWPTLWPRVDNGLLTAVFSQVDYTELFKDFEQRDDFQTESMQKLGRVLREFLSRPTKIAVSLDIADAEKTEQVGLRMHWVYASTAEARQASENLREILTLYKSIFEGELKGPVKEGAIVADKNTIEFYDAMFAAAVLAVNEYDDHTAAVTVSTVFPTTALLQWIVPDESPESPSTGN